MKILVVDDEGVARRIMREIVSGSNHEPVEATDGEHAWELFQRDPVRVILCDWVMPGIDGLELCRKIREESKEEYPYFVLLTDKRTDRKSYLKAIHDGVDDFLLKPLDPESVWFRLRVAERILGLEHQINQLEKIIPICSYCKRIRRNDNVFEQMEVYIAKHTDSLFSHVICLECKKKYFPESP